jgi:hypothetical protein
LISTDSARNDTLRQLRLPPAPGLLKDLISEGVRARQRRLWMQQRQETDLLAMTVPDTTIARSVQAAALQGREARRWLSAEIAAETSKARSGALVFLAAALHVQTCEDGWLEDVLELVKIDSQAVQDALTAFPVSVSIWGESTEHVKPLWSASLQGRIEPAWVCRLITSTGSREVLDDLQLRLTRGVSTQEELVALAALGDQSPALKERLLRSLSLSASDACSWAALEVAPTLLEPSELRSLMSEPGRWPHQAWPWMALRDPAWVLSNPGVWVFIPDHWRLRLFALMGHLAALFSVCADLSQHDMAASSEQRDALILMAGECPNEVAISGGEQTARDKALRTLFLRVCRQAHVGVHNDADQCPWQLDRILSEPSASQPAVRMGQRMPVIPALDARFAELSHVMRQWVYMERAAKAGHPFPLNALTVSRRQWQAMDVAGFVDELRNR